MLFRSMRAGNDEVEIGVGHLVDHRIEHELAVDEADARATDGTEEGDTRDRECGRGRHHAKDVGIVFHVVREHGDDHLRVAAIAVGEERADRAIDQARGQRLLF